MRCLSRPNGFARLSDGAKSPPIPSAAILLLRDVGEDLEVLLLTRHDTASFGGASVFPGGKVDVTDSDTKLFSYCDGLAPKSEIEHAFYVAAIREVFEETGLLLARSDGNTALLSSAQNAAISARYRNDLLRGAITLPEIVTRENLRLACDVLVPFSRWITPTIAPKRFDTFFFLTDSTHNNVATADGTESLQVDWITPRAALAEAEAGLRRIVFPTRATLSKLALTHCVAAALASARASGLVTVQPEIKTGGAEGAVICLPPEAGYPICEVPLAAVFDPRNYPGTKSGNTDGDKD